MSNDRPRLSLIVLGPPGAGKGTQAKRIARARGIPAISTGEILRDAVGNGTPIGLRAKAVMDRGELVGDDVMIEIVAERLRRSDAAAGFVLDGFPRTVAQATALDAMMSGGALVVIDIVVPEAELIRRLGSRLICADCGATAGGFEQDGPAGDPTKCHKCGGRLVQRSDDNEAVVRERLKVYERQTAPLVEYYRVRPTFRSVDGAQPADRVAADLAAAIEAASAAGSARGGERR